MPDGAGLSHRLQAASEVASAEGPEAFATGLHFTPDSRHLVAATNDWRVVRWRLETGEVVKEVRGVHRGRVGGLSVSGNGVYLATGGADRQVKVWEASMSGSPPPLYQSFNGHAGPVTTLAFSK